MCSSCHPLYNYMEPPDSYPFKSPCSLHVVSPCSTLQFLSSRFATFRNRTPTGPEPQVSQKFTNLTKRKCAETMEWSSRNRGKRLKVWESPRKSTVNHVPDFPEFLRPIYPKYTGVSTNKFPWCATSPRCHGSDVPRARQELQTCFTTAVSIIVHVHIISEMWVSLKIGSPQIHWFIMVYRDCPC